MQSIENTKAYRARAAAMRAVALMSASATAMALFAAPAYAQATASSQPADSAGDEGGAIIVTGSRIAKPELESSVPVAVVSSQAITDAGQTNLLDALRDLPLAGQSAGTSASNFSNFDNGTATVNLRNLGSARTLVLINGRRSVGIPGSSAVDLNNIPTDLIDHVEIATGGTSAVYGSDAVAGVVNIILKNKFEGLQFHAQDMISSEGDGRRVLLSGTGGWSFASGAGHVVVNGSYTKDDAVRASSRDYSKNDSPSKSSYAAQGLFDTNGDGQGGSSPDFAPSSADNGTFTFDRNNNVKPFQSGSIDGYNRAADRLLTTPVERYSGSLLANYEFSKAADLYVEFLYNKTKARASIEPLAVDDQGVQGQSVFNFDGSAFAGIPVTNPYLPAQIANAAIANGQNVVNFRRRSNGIFDRSPVDDRDYWRAVVGLKGDIGSGWNYDLSYEHSQVRDDTLSGAILMNNYGAALQAVTVGGQVVCADPVARAAGCVPINIFGFTTPSPAAIKWLTTYSGQGVVVPGATAGQAVTDDFLRKNWQDVVTFTITGSPIQLPAGPLGVAVGAEYHREKATELYDPFTIAGISAAQQASDTVGKYHSKEAYVELSVPLLGKMPLVEDLSLEGAARYADYSTVGGVWSYKVGGSYAPSHDLRFRAVFARAVRAPNINELDAKQSTTAPQVIDPCDQYQGNGDVPKNGPIALASGCSAIPGLSAYAQSHGGLFAYTLAQVQTVTGLLGGNPNLNAEATDTFTAGLTFTPTFLRNFYVTADYYTIKVKNAIASVDPQTSVDQCFQTGSPAFCQYVTRNANGFITQVNSFNINAASYLVAGLDVQSRYTFRTKLIGADDRLDFSVFYNHKFKQQQTPFVGGPVSDELGRADTYASSQLGTGFKDQFTFNANYTTGPFTLVYRLKYLGPVAASVGGGDLRIPAFTYHDLQAKLSVGEKKQFEFYVGADNLFNKQPPFIASGNSQWPGTNTVADTYDLVGRMMYVGVTTKF